MSAASAGVAASRAPLATRSSALCGVRLDGRAADDLIRDFFADVPFVAPVLRNRLDAIIAGDHEGWFSTTLGLKDVRLAEGLARSQGIRLPVAEALRGRYEEAAAGGWADTHITAVVELLRKRP